MANVKISALPAVTTVVPGSDVLPLVSGGITTKATPNAIVQAVLPAPGAIGGTTPSTGSFTNLTYSGTLTGGTGVISIGSGQFYKDASGNVGIGTSSPQSRLNVYNSTAGGAVLTLSDGTLGVTYGGQFKGYGTGGIGGFAEFGSLDAGIYSRGFLVAQQANYLSFYTGTGGSSTEKMRIDSSGNLGLGVTPSGWLAEYKAFEMPQIALFSGAGGGGFLYGNAYLNASATPIYKVTGLAATALNNQGGGFQFNIAPSGTAGNAISFTQAMTLDASGNLLVGTTSQINLCKVGILFDEQVYIGLVLKSSNATTGGSFQYFVNSAGALAGSISHNGSTTVAYNTSSDHRLKTNIIPAGSAIKSILDFPVDQFDWIESGEHQDFGAVAQKAIKVIPEMVTVPADSDEMWGIDWSKAVPRLIKTIQEMHEEIQILKQKVNA